MVLRHHDDVEADAKFGWYRCQGTMRQHTSKTSHGKGWRNRTLAVPERVNSRFLVLPGGLSIFTRIIGAKYFSLP